MGDLEVANLPLKSRDTFELLQLQPGVQSTLGADLFFGGDQAGVVSVDGGRARSNNYNVNGGHSGDQFINSPSIQPSPDSISEFRVISHNYDALTRAQFRIRDQRDHKIWQQHTSWKHLRIFSQQGAECQRIFPPCIPPISSRTSSAASSVGLYVGIRLSFSLLMRVGGCGRGSRPTLCLYPRNKSAEVTSQQVQLSRESSGTMRSRRTLLAAPDAPRQSQRMAELGSQRVLRTPVFSLGMLFHQRASTRRQPI